MTTTKRNDTVSDARAEFDFEQKTAARNAASAKSDVNSNAVKSNTNPFAVKAAIAKPDENSITVKTASAVKSDINPFAVNSNVPAPNANAAIAKPDANSITVKAASAKPDANSITVKTASAVKSDINPFAVNSNVPAPNENAAAIDVGSNSVRRLFRGKKIVEITALSEGLMTTGRLKPEAMERTAEAIFRLKQDAEANGAEAVFVFATEAVRAAENRAEFISLLRQGGVTLDLLSSEQEAEIGFSGAYTSGICAVADIGGASTELTVGTENGLVYSHSLPLGCVRLRDYSDEKSEQIRYARLRMKEYGKVPAFGDLIVIGGTSSTFVAVREKLEPYDPEVVQGYRLKRKDVEEITDRFDRTPLSERGKIAGLQEKKAPTAVSSGVMLAELMRYLGREECVVSERDNLEGYLLSKSF